MTYTPTPGTYGHDSFVFQATDDKLGVGQATVSLTVTPVNLAPVAMAQTVTVVPNQQRLIVLEATDTETPGSQLTYTIGTEPAHGTLTQVSATTFDYTPAAGYAGSDSFTFTATDTGNPPGTAANVLTSAPATVSLNVAAIPPHAVSDSYTVIAGFTLRIPAATGLLANDTDADGIAPTATLSYPQPAHGTLTLSPDGSFVYTPNAGFTGTDSFAYTVADAYAQGNQATVTITVTPSPKPVIPPAKGKVPAPPAPVVSPPAVNAAAPVAVASSTASTASTASRVDTVLPQSAAAAVPAAAIAAPLIEAPSPAAPVAAVPASPAIASSTPVAASSPIVVTPAPISVALAPYVMPPAVSADALMLPAMPQIQRLPAALQALLPASKPIAMLDPIFFDAGTGEQQGVAASAMDDDDWVVFDGIPTLEHRHIAWDARH